MATVDDMFLKATEDVKLLSVKPDDATLLLLYGYYKQATIGDNNKAQSFLARPFFNFKESAKWNAWDKLKGMQKIQAQGNYIKLVKDLQIKSQN